MQANGAHRGARVADVLQFPCILYSYCVANRSMIIATRGYAKFERKRNPLTFDCYWIIPV